LSATLSIRPFLAADGQETKPEPKRNALFGVELDLLITADFPRNPQITSRIALIYRSDVPDGGALSRRKWL
jgi:hypothetical protein